MKTTPRLLRTELAGVLTLLCVTGQVFAQHPLDSWGRRTVPAPNSALNSIAYGNGTFVAVGYDSFIVRSTDGVTWTTSTAGSYGILKKLNFINGQFVAVGASDKIIYSLDGASWTASTLPSADFWDIAFGNGVYVLAGASTYVSADGINWTQVHPMLPGPLGSSGLRETPLDTVASGNGGFLALPLALPHPNEFQPRQSLFSTNGIDWVRAGFGQTSPVGGQGEALYYDGVWLSVMDNPVDIRTFGGIMASTNDGASWDHRVDNFFAGQGSALAYGQGYLVAFLYYDSVRVVTSTNGFLTWEERFPAAIERFAWARGVAFGNGTFVAVGYDQHSEGFILQSGDIGGAPIIFQEPQDRSAVVDNPVTFSVQAVGALPLSYQWYRNDDAISGATNTSYTIAHVATSDVGGYHVVITNSINSVTSRVAQLTVAFLGISQYAGIKILGVPGRTYQIDATPASGSPNWQTLTNLPLPATPYIWIDYESPSMPARIYRAAELP